jgi:hypothetical protein
VVVCHEFVASLSAKWLVVLGRARAVVGSRWIVAVLIALGLAAGFAPAFVPARAETPIELRVTAPPVLKPRAPARRPKVEPPVDEEPPVAPPQRRPADAEEEDTAEAEDGSSAVAAAARDGDMTVRAEVDGPRDGVIEVEEPRPVLDGDPDRRTDARTPQDFAAFEGPPAGYNPYLFQIEPDPLTDRRTAELFRIEPYVATGIRIGSFVLFPEAEFGAIFTNNIFRSPTPDADSAFETRGSLRLVSDWSRHAVELRGSGLASFYKEYSTEDDRAYTLEARGRLDIAKRTNIEGLLSNQLDRSVRSTQNLPTDAARRGDIETNRAAGAFNHHFNRLGLQLRGAVIDVHFAPVPIIGGGIISNTDRSYTQRDAALRTSWAIRDRVDVFAEAQAVEREFFVPPSDGILRSSHGERYRLGVSFGHWDATVRGEASIGWGRQAPDSSQLAAIEGFIVDANLAWRATALTTVLLTASSDFVDTTMTGSLGGLSRTVGLEARHTFRRYLVGIAGVRYVVTPYESTDVVEHTLTSEVGFDYYLGRNIVIYGRYQHIAYETTAPDSNYEDDIVRFGMRVRQ